VSSLPGVCIKVLLPGIAVFLCRFSYILEGEELPDFIELSVCYYGRLVGGRPYQVRVLEEGPLSQSWFREWPESDLVAKEDITLILDTALVQDDITQRLPLLKFKVQCEQTGNEVKYTVEELKSESNVFSLKFNPPQEGHYSIYTSYRGKEIAESGLDLEVFPPPLFLPALRPFYFLHETFTFTVKLNKAMASSYSYYGYNIRDLVVEVAKVGVVKRRVLGDSCSVELCGGEVGTMFITLTHSHLNYEKIMSTEIRELPPPTLECQQVTHDGGECVASLLLQAPHTHLAGYTDGKGKNLAVGVKENIELDPALEHLKDHEFLVTLKTSTPDLYKLSLYYYGRLLPVCPFMVDMTTSSEEVQVYDPVIPFELGEAIELVLDTSKAGLTTTSQLKLNVKDSIGKDLPLKIKVECEGDHLFRLSFVPRKYGIYNAHIWHCNKPIKNSPLILPFQPRGQALANVSYQPNLGSRVVVTAILRVQGEEVMDQQGDWDHDVASSVSSSALPQLTVQQFQQGQYLIRLHGCQQNIFHLHVFCLGNEIKGSPFVIDTTKPPLGIATPSKQHMLRLPKNEYRCHGYLIAELLNDKSEAEISKFILNDDQSIAHLEISKKTEPWQPCQVQVYWNDVPFCGGPFTLPSRLRQNVEKNDSSLSEYAAEEEEAVLVDDEENLTNVLHSSSSSNKMADSRTNAVSSETTKTSDKRRSRETTV